MSRMKIETTPTFADESLDNLIPSYAEHKSELDGMKKTVDFQNGLIKDIMSRMGEDEYSASGYTAKRIVTHKESVDEAMLLEVVKRYRLPAIKTVEIVDTDALENYLYNHEMSDELAEAIDRCRKVTEVVQLRVGKTKKKKEIEE